MNSSTINIRIDIAQMKSKVLELADKYLKEINEINLEYFAEEVKKVAETCLEKYIFDVYDLFTEGPLRIEEMDKLESFTDTTTGYQQQMLNWKKSNAISITKKVVSIPDSPEKPKEKTYYRTTIGIGTFIAAGLVILNHPWIALAVELLTLSASYAQYKQNNKKKDEYAIKLQIYNIEIKQKIKEFVGGIMDDLENWLLLGQAKSDEVIQSFNL